MPELPEVERGRRLAKDVAVGRRIERVWCNDDSIVFDAVGPRRWRRALEGKRIEAARRWGKQLWLELSAPPHPLFHFGMAGGFKSPAAEPLQLVSGPREDSTVWPPRFVKIRIHLDDGGELAMTDGRRLGRIVLRDDPQREPPVVRLGFDPLLAMPAPKRFSEMLRARSGNLKSLLLEPVVRGRRRQLDCRRGALPGRNRSPAQGVVTDGCGSAARARPARGNRQAGGRCERRRLALSPRVAVPPALGKAGRCKDCARRADRARDDRRAHHCMGAKGAALRRWDLSERAFSIRSRPRPRSRIWRHRPRRTRTGVRIAYHADRLCRDRIPCDNCVQWI